MNISFSFRNIDPVLNKSGIIHLYLLVVIKEFHRNSSQSNLVTFDYFTNLYIYKKKHTVLTQR